MPNMTKNVNNSGYFLILTSTFSCWLSIYEHYDMDTNYIYTWHEADQNITPSINGKWNTKINTIFLYTKQNYKWYACCVM